MHICHQLSIHLNNFFERKSRRNCKIILDGKKLQGFPWWRDWEKSLHYQKNWFDSPLLPYLFCHQNFDFAIFVQCLFILAKMNPKVNGCIFWKILGLKYKKKPGFTRFALRNFYLKIWQLTGVKSKSMYVVIPWKMSHRLVPYYLGLKRQNTWFKGFTPMVLFYKFHRVSMALK